MGLTSAPDAIGTRAIRQTPCPWTRRAGPSPRLRSAAADQVPEPNRVDEGLELLHAVDLDNRHADPVRVLEVVVAVDPDLLELERRPFAFGQDDRPGLVAQPARPPREHQDLREGALGGH